MSFGSITVSVDLSEVWDEIDDSDLMDEFWKRFKGKRNTVFRKEVLSSVEEMFGLNEDNSDEVNISRYVCDKEGLPYLCDKEVLLNIIKEKYL